MPATLTAPTTQDTLQELIDRLGGVPLSRVLTVPPPGTATEQDVLDIHARTNRLCELVDGTLVEKPMGFRESALAGKLVQRMRNFVEPRKLGTVTAPDGMMRLSVGLIRIPDVAFIPWDRFPDRKLPKEPILALAPDLAVEVLSKSNSGAEMERKCREYFAAGVQLVWLIDPESRTADVFTVPDQSTTLDASQSLDGGTVLPGFSLPLAELFAELDQQ